MRIAVFGMGYIGCVSAACLANEGHTVVGVDISADKVALINRGVSPIVEERIPELLKFQVDSGRLSATTDSRKALLESEMCFVCVGTPSRPNGDLELGYLTRVSAQLGEALKDAPKGYPIIYRSTMLPGTVEGMLIPLLEQHSGKKAGEDFEVCFHPEFLREGTSVADFYDPPKTVVGTGNPEVEGLLRQLYGFLTAPFFATSIRVAETIKYADNAFHALKIGFANEVGRFCKKLDIDSWQVMEIFCQDRKLNISPYYLLPGFAFGGSCLPKDLRALTYRAKVEDIDLPILNAVLPSNQEQILHAFHRIQAAGKRRIGILGLTFKQGTDDLRESATVSLVEMLLGKGYQIRIYDEHVNLARLIGSNREFLEQRIPHIASLLTSSLEEMMADAEVLVVGQKHKEFLARAASIGPEVLVYDLVRAFPLGAVLPANYEGICW